MSHHQPTNRDRCPECGSTIIIDMDGLWSYRVCARNGHLQDDPARGPLPSMAMFYPARG